jgi:hypothetical protein
MAAGQIRILEVRTIKATVDELVICPHDAITRDIGKVAVFESRSCYFMVLQVHGCITLAANDCAVLHQPCQGVSSQEPFDRCIGTINFLTGMSKANGTEGVHIIPSYPK